MKSKIGFTLTSTAMTTVMAVAGLLTPILSSGTASEESPGMAVPAKDSEEFEGTEDPKDWEFGESVLKDPGTGKEIDPDTVDIVDSDGTKVVYNPATGKFVREKDGKIVYDPSTLKAFPKKRTGTTYTKRPKTVNNAAKSDKAPRGRSLNAPVDSGSKPVKRPVYRPNITRTPSEEPSAPVSEKPAEKPVETPSAKKPSEKPTAPTEKPSVPGETPSVPAEKPSEKPSTPAETPSEPTKTEEPLVIEVNLTGGQEVIDECKGAVNYENYNHISEHNYCGGDRYNSLKVGDKVILKGTAITQPGTYVVKEIYEAKAGDSLPEPKPFNLQTSVTDSIVRIWALGEVTGE